MLVAALLALLLAAPADEDCLACHGERDAQAGDGRSVHVVAQRLKAGAHGGLGCSDCHAGISELPHAERLPAVNCATCHEDAAAELGRSVHQRTAETASPQDEVTCRSCHGAAHDVRSQGDASSSVSKHNLPQTCGGCHASDQFLARHPHLHARPVEAYRQGVHGRAIERGEQKAAACSDCHGSHGIRASTHPESKINRKNIAATCGACHATIASAYAGSVHGEAARRDVPAAPVCTDCHGEHRILGSGDAASQVSSGRLATETCGRCHGDERITERYGLSADRLPSFEESYHGLALKSGSKTAANCASCHGVHDILPMSNPRSSVHPKNLAATCGKCHPGAGGSLALGPIHVRSDGPSVHPVVRWVRRVYLVLIPLSVGLMLLHNLIDFVAKLRRDAPRPHGSEQLPRMGRHFRIAHGLVMLSFTVLVWTGFALKFPGAWWAAPLLAFEDRLALRGGIHRFAGAVLVLATLYHFVHLALVRRDRVVLRQLLPRRRDAADLLGMLRYNLGGAPRPALGKFTYAEKAEYWAFQWGTVVMAVTGALLWFADFTLSHFPKWVADAATAVHWYEAILATLAILVWHFYFVIFDPDVYPMERAWFTGNVSAEHLRRTRPAYYRALRAAAEAQAEPEGGAVPPEPGPLPAPQPATPAPQPDDASPAPANDAAPGNAPPDEPGSGDGS